MKKLRLGLSLIGLSIFALLILDYLPGPWVDEMRYADSTFSYVVMGLIFYFAIYFLGCDHWSISDFPAFISKPF